MIITDGMLSYAVFIYKCDLLQWSGLTNHAVIGYNMNGQFLNLPLAWPESSFERGLCKFSSYFLEHSAVSYGDLEGELQRSRAECIRRIDEDSALFSNDLVQNLNSVALLVRAL